MGKVTYIMVCFIIVTLDAIVTIFCFKARAYQNQAAEHSSLIFECQERSDDATLQLRFALMLLIAAHLIVNFLATQIESEEALGCWKLRIICIILTWLIFGVAVTMMVFGTESNEKSSCIFTYRPLVLVGGILSISHALFGIAPYFASAAFPRKTASSSRISPLST